MTIIILPAGTVDRGGKGDSHSLWYSLQNNSPFVNSNLGKHTSVSARNPVELIFFFCTM